MLYFVVFGCVCSSFLFVPSLLSAWVGPHPKNDVMQPSHQDFLGNAWIARSVFLDRLWIARLGSASSAWPGSARPGLARLGSARLGSARPGSARLGSARPGPARLGSARLGPARLGSALPLTPPGAKKVSKWLPAAQCIIHCKN